MKISVTVKTKKKEEKVEAINNNEFIVSVKEAPIEGRANQAMIKSLAEYFNVAKSDINIISGLNSKHKIIEIDKN